jgi:hypothetical protein
MSGTVLYTAILGGCDSVKVAPAGPDQCVLFTDDKSLADPREVELHGWEVRVSPPSKHPRMTSRQLRCSPHLLFPSADVVVWLDASCTMVNFAALVAAAGSTELAALAHPDRSSCADESMKCVQLGYRSMATHTQQMREMQAAGYPFDRLTAGHLTWRRNTEKVRQFNRLWLNQIQRYGVRDQCSLDFSAWSAGLDVVHVAGSYRRNPYFQYHLTDHHRRRKP